jgi:hypothetical protein
MLVGERRRRRRDATSSLVKMLLTWRSTVRSLMPRLVAISRFVRRSATSRSTSSSAG